MASRKIDASNEDLAAQVETLKNDLAKLAKTIKSEAKHQAESTTETAKAVINEKAEVIQHQYEEISGQAEAHIRKNPLSSVAIAFGVGMLFGMIRN